MKKLFKAAKGIISVLIYLSIPLVVVGVYLEAPHYKLIAIITVSIHIIYLQYSLWKVTNVNKVILENQLNLTGSLTTITRGKKRKIQRTLNKS